MMMINHRHHHHDQYGPHGLKHSMQNCWAYLIFQFGIYLYLYHPSLNMKEMIWLDMTINYHLATGVRCSAVMVEEEDSTRVYKQSWMLGIVMLVKVVILMLIMVVMMVMPLMVMTVMLMVVMFKTTWPQGSSGQDDEVTPQLESPSQASICLTSFSPTWALSIGFCLQLDFAPVGRRGRWRSTEVYRRRATGTCYLGSVWRDPKSKSIFGKKKKAEFL